MNSQFEARLNKVGATSAGVVELFVRGSGSGGQKINKTSSTVYLKHSPTGIEVRCQQERSQAVNRELAWATLCEKLEGRAKATKNAIIDARESERRRNRQKSYGQKVRMIQTKKRRSEIKGKRGKVGFE